MKKCRHCKINFKPRFSTLERVCQSYTCLVSEAMAKVAKEQEKRKKADKERLKQMKLKLETVQSLTKKAQAVFNKYIRLRDNLSPCISCGKMLTGKFDAGHYYSSGYHKAVTFDEDNVHGQCVHCNQHLHGNIINYQVGIVQRIGADRVFELNRKAHETRKFTREELLEIVDKYKKKCKDILK